jgi:hypothetical protein
MPALFTRKSIRPKESLVCFTISAAASVLATSPWEAKQRAPNASISDFKVAAASALFA